MSSPDRAIEEVKNLGPTSAAWLRSVGIETYGDLEDAGAVEAYLSVRSAGFNATRNLLYGLQAALLGVKWTHLPEVEKKRLEAELAAAEDNRSP